MERKILDYSIIHLEEIRSTNTYLQELDATHPQPEGTLVYTDTQSAGRGQRGNSWESEPGKNLTFSLLLHPEHIPANRQFLLSQAVSLAMIDLLSPYAQGFSIKWPNDIYWNDRKIAGILIENVLSGTSFTRAIVGIGLNINQETFVSDAPNPVSLLQITGKEHPIETILNQFMEAFEHRYRETFASSNESIQQEYAHNLYRREGYHPYSCEEETFLARIVDVEPDGHLLLSTPADETRRFAFKEVAFIL